MQLLNIEGLKVPVNVKQSRSIFGREELLISPIDGEGERWVTKSKVLFPCEETIKNNTNENE